MKRKVRKLYLQTKQENNYFFLPCDLEPFQESGPNQRLLTMLQFPSLVNKKRKAKNLE